MPMKGLGVLQEMVRGHLSILLPVDQALCEENGPQLGFNSGNLLRDCAEGCQETGMSL